jgi:hypothetical protein
LGICGWSRYVKVWNEFIWVQNMRVTFSGTGIATGLLCITTLFLIDAYGPGSYSGSGSGCVMADGTITVVASSRPLLPVIAQAAFLGFVIPLLLGMVGAARKENLYFAAGSFCFGLAPVLIYTAGVPIASMLYLGVSLPLLAVYAFNKAC